MLLKDHIFGGIKKVVSRGHFFQALHIYKKKHKNDRENERTRLTTLPALFSASTACPWVTLTVDIPFTDTMISFTLRAASAATCHRSSSSDFYFHWNMHARVIHLEIQFCHIFTRTLLGLVAQWLGRSIGDRGFNPGRWTVKCDLEQVVHTHVHTLSPSSITWY